MFSNIFDLAKEKDWLIVQLTAIGKTHVIIIVGTLINGVDFILHPLLTLMAHQVVQFDKGNF